MFETEIALNGFQLRLFNKILVDLPETQWYTPGAGHGHTPVWIVGHLAYVAEFGQGLLGAEPTHPDWGRLFGIRSSDVIEPAAGLEPAALSATLRTNYARLCELCQTADATYLAGSHEMELFRGTPMKTRQQLLSHVLTSHFGFHLAQLSSCRREAGLPALF